MAVARRLAFAHDHETRGLLHRLQEGNRKLAGFDLPIGHHGPGDLVDDDVFRKLDAGLFRGALRDFKVHLGIKRGGVLTQAGELRERAALAQRQADMMVFHLAMPGEGQRLIAAGVSQPEALAGAFRLLRQQPAGKLQVNPEPRKLHLRARDAGRSGRQGNALFAGGCVYRQRYIEQQHGPSGMGQHYRGLVAAFSRRRRDQRDQLAVQASFAHQQAGWNRHAHPAIFQHVHGEADAARSQLAQNMQIVVHTGQRGVHRRRFRIMLGGKGPRAQVLVFVHRNDDPAG